MGVLEEKETGPSSVPTEQQNNQETEDPKETDKMLEKKDDDSVAISSGGGGGVKQQTKSSPVLAKKINSDKKSPSPATSEKELDKKVANGEEIINIPDGDGKNNKTEDMDKKPITNQVTNEGREVKPKKIPIGGIKMPGFFTKTKPKGEGDGADNELLKEDVKEPITIVNEKQRPTIGARILNFFTRKSDKKSDDNKNDAPPAENDENTGVTTAAINETAPPQKRGLLNAIKLPIANMIPKKKTDDDIELGNGPGTKAGLASMETLDDSLKDQDTVDKAPIKNTDDVEKLKDNKDSTKSSNSENGSTSCLERMRSYKCSVDDVLITLGIILFLLLLGVIGYVLSHESLTSPPIREGRFIDAVTSCGMVEGLKEDGAFAFRGIPYALPPTEENRFKPAQIMQIDNCWNGTLKAHNATELCSQVLSNGTIVGVEDCLTLDVVTPHVRYDSPLPVVVLIGAETLTGGSPGILRPSARYARSKDVIFVRPNFRLGAFGFLALETLTKSTYLPTSGNYGLSDILAALKWVQLNIGHFGGDPKAVTLFGHRAGGTLVTALISSRKIKGLYKRAWVSSSSAIFPGKSLKESEKRNQDFMNQLQCADVNCLRNASTEEIWTATPDTWRQFPATLPTVDENPSARHEWLVLDGDILQQHPSDLWKEELIGQLKLVIGTTAHESHTEQLRALHANWTPEEVRAYIEKSKIGQMNLTDEAIQRYNATYEGLVAMISDIRTVCPLLTNARLQPTVPFYVVTQVDSKTNLAQVDADVQAILGRYEPHTVEQRRYFSSIQQLFYHYVSHGVMLQYEPRRRVINIEQDPISYDDYPNCNFWISKDIVPRHARID